MEDFLKFLLKSNQCQLEASNALLEEQRRANMLKVEELQLQKEQAQLARGRSQGIRASDFIPKMILGMMQKPSFIPSK